MIQSRIRPDGIRELRDTEDGMVVQIPNNQGISADSAFPMARREEFFARHFATRRFDWAVSRSASIYGRHSRYSGDLRQRPTRDRYFT
jgi:hypothetical protein